MTAEPISFEGHTCVRLEGERSTLFVTTSVGPRIVGLGPLVAPTPGDGASHRETWSLRDAPA